MEFTVENLVTLPDNLLNQLINPVDNTTAKVHRPCPVKLAGHCPLVWNLPRIAPPGNTAKNRGKFA